tara:strand:+ start:377 stop:724 length:348 start_codon:yes stop_codon:yes gene_type:complete
MVNAAHDSGSKPKRAIKKGPNPRKPMFGTYIHTVMKQIGGEVSISSDAMLVVDGIVIDFMDRLNAKSFRMAKYDGKSTLKAKHARGAVSNMLRGDLCKCALTEGEKAVAKFTASA